MDADIVSTVKPQRLEKGIKCNVGNDVNDDPDNDINDDDDDGVMISLMLLCNYIYCVLND